VGTEAALDAGSAHEASRPRSAAVAAAGTWILQPHHILDEFQGSGGRALAEGPFLDVLRFVQVWRSELITHIFRDSD
jgi:hypothetical protein